MLQILPQYVAVDAVAGAPDDLAFPVGHFLRGAQVVQVVEVALVVFGA